MINIESLFSFLTLSLLLAVSPGPSNAFLMAQTFAKGQSAGMQSAFGFASSRCHTHHFRCCRTQRYFKNL